jgi:hypothetical protein
MVELQVIGDFLLEPGYVSGELYEAAGDRAAGAGADELDNGGPAPTGGDDAAGVEHD